MAARHAWEVEEAVRRLRDFGASTLTPTDPAFWGSQATDAQMGPVHLRLDTAIRDGAAHLRMSAPRGCATMTSMDAGGAFGVLPHGPYECPVCEYAGLSAKPYAVWPPPPGTRLEPPYEDALGSPSYEVCIRCGFEFGNDDNPGTAAPSSFQRYRDEWLADGSPWFMAPLDSGDRNNAKDAKRQA